MDSFIVDASIGVKWFFEETLQKPALDLFHRLKRNQVRLIVPQFFYLEMGNVCWKRVQKKMIKGGEAISVLDHLMSLPLENYPDHELADVALENAIRFGITAYDGLYLALAEAYVAPLVTADSALLKACKDRFEFIVSLQDVFAG